MHCTVKLWNELLSANTNKLRSSNSLCHRAKPKHLEADSATGSWTCENRRHMVIRDPVPEVQYRVHIVLHAWHARRNDSVMHSDTLILVSLSYCLLIAKFDFEKVLYEKGKRRELSMQVDPGNVNHCFMRSPYRCKLNHRL